MISIKNILIFAILSTAVWSCNTIEQPSPQPVNIDQTMIYHQLLSMEYALLNEDYAVVSNHSNNLDMLLKEGYNLFCPGESAQIDGIRLTNRILLQHLNNNETKYLLDDLRILKGAIINLESDEDYDPYFAFLWRFEEDMYSCTELAMDPMLDLLEWNEFLYSVDCMNESWWPLKMHFPSPEMLNNDPVKFKNQSIYKIYLEKAIEDFNMAVDAADSEKYLLCDSAENVRKAYFEYILTFIESMKKSDSFLALL